MTVAPPDWRHPRWEESRGPHRCNNCPHPHVELCGWVWVLWSAYGDTIIGEFDNLDDATAETRRRLEDT